MSREDPVARWASVQDVKPPATREVSQSAGLQGGAGRGSALTLSLVALSLPWRLELARAAVAGRAAAVGSLAEEAACLAALAAAGLRAGLPLAGLPHEGRAAAPLVAPLRCGRRVRGVTLVVRCDGLWVHPAERVQPPAAHRPELAAASAALRALQAQELSASRNTRRRGGWPTRALAGATPLPVPQQRDVPGRPSRRNERPQAGTSGISPYNQDSMLCTAEN